MLPIVSVIFGAFWQLLFYALAKISTLSALFRGFIMMLLTLAFTGGLHMDGFMDTCDAIFSHQDRTTRLNILSDTHVGSFAVMGCVIIMMSKTFLFAEIINCKNIFIIPICSRLGMSILLNNLPFAKSNGLAVALGALRKKSDNFYLLVMIILFVFINVKITAIMSLCVISWSLVCTKIFGGITGDLLGAFVELSEVVMLTSLLKV